MLFIRQLTSAAKRNASYATWARCERLFGGHGNVDPAGGSRDIKPMSQILEPSTLQLGGYRLEPFFIGSRESRPGEVDLGGFFHFCDRSRGTANEAARRE